MARLQSSGSRAGLALAGIGEQLLQFFNGIDHGIAVLNISVVIQYHAMRTEPFMVFVILSPGVLRRHRAEDRQHGRMSACQDARLGPPTTRLASPYSF